MLNQWFSVEHLEVWVCVLEGLVNIVRKCDFAAV